MLVDQLTDKVNTRLQRDSLAKQVAYEIRKAIVVGTIQPGQKLTEAELVEKFAVSHIVIREAFHVLQGEGILVKTNSRSRSVFAMDESTALDFTVLRASLESFAAYWATERLTESWKQRIIEAGASMKRFSAANYSEWVELELAFHRTIWAAAQSECLSDQLGRLVVPMFAMTTRFFRREIKPNGDFQEQLQVFARREETDHPQGHQRIVKSILRADPHKARETMILHVLGPPCFEELRKRVFQAP